MFLAWGPGADLASHDAFIPLSPDGSTRIDRKPASEVWSEAWTDLQPMFDRGLFGGPLHMTAFKVGLDREAPWKTPTSIFPILRAG